MTFARLPLAACVALASLSACGRGDVPPNERGIWAFGAPDVPAATFAQGGAPAASAPPPALPTQVSTPVPFATPTPATRVTGVETSPARAAAQAYAVSPPSASGTIRGVVRLTGAPAKVLQFTDLKDKEKGCKDHASERVAVGPDGRLGNCLVTVPALSSGKDWPASMRGEERALTVDQVGCVYVPHLGVARPRTQLVVVNSDRAEHNIHGYRGVTTADGMFNFSSPPGTTNAENEAAFLEKAGAYFLKCDIHPWMNAYVHAVANPYFDVTLAADDPATGGRAAGEFVIEGVPPGVHEVVCWHEGMREEPLVAGGKIATYTYSAEISRTAKVTVVAGETATCEFAIPYE